MKRADVIIGANFGDEGKGLFTDYLVNQRGVNTLVVRANGGAQAGHTVISPEGKRHVFGHIGSGALCGASTFLSRYFVCNPLLYLKEEAKLGFSPTVYVDYLAPVTTPWDMMINHIVEEARGEARHGSCGVGFGEALERQDNAAFRLTVQTMTNAKQLKKIRSQWVPLRLAALGIKTVPEVWKQRLMDDAILEGYLEAATLFLAKVQMVGAYFLANWAGDVVFEGAQGLLLDQDNAWFPHVTRSYTGLTNVVKLAEDAGIEALDVLYATRSYLTRHGAGPLPGELASPPYLGIYDPTNAPNLYQGRLRFAWLDMDLLKTTITRDLVQAQKRMRITPRLGMSCLDQVGSLATYMHEGYCRTASGEAMFATLCEALDMKKDALASYGPTRLDVVAFSEHRHIQDSLDTSLTVTTS